MRDGFKGIFQKIKNIGTRTKKTFQTQTIPNLGKLTHGISSQDAILRPKCVNQSDKSVGTCH